MIAVYLEHNRADHTSMRCAVACSNLGDEVGLVGVVACYITQGCKRLRAFDILIPLLGCIHLETVTLL